MRSAWEPINAVVLKKRRRAEQQNGYMVMNKLRKFCTSRMHYHRRADFLKSIEENGGVEFANRC